MSSKLILAAAAATVSFAGLAQAQVFTQVNRIFLDGAFNATTANGDNPASLAFDGTTAYVGGFNAVAGNDSVGLVAVTDLYGTFATGTITPVTGTTRTVVGPRGYESLAFDAATGSILAATNVDSSTATYSRLSPSGTTIFSVTNPAGVRPFAVGSDPIAPGGDPSLAAFLTQGSGRRLGLDIDTGAVVYNTTGPEDPAPGGAVIFQTALGSAFRGVDFDSEGNIAYASANGVGYGARNAVNGYSALSIVVANTGANNIGRDVAILEGVGAGGTDLLALALRDSTGIDDTRILITDLSGNVLQTLSGDESGLATAFTNDTKAVDFALAPDGTPTLAVLDFVERRLDIYQVPEPASLGMLGVAGLGLLRRRKA